MSNFYDIIQRLIEADLSKNEQRLAVKDFAYYFGWTPSESIETSEMNYAKKHIVVEHGLENTAVISFLNRPFADLSVEERQRLLNVSYNNLVDWHIQIEREQVTFVFNRTDPERVVRKVSIARDKTDALRSRFFEEVSDRRQPSNLPALDDALIKTIQFWKPFLATEIGIPNPNIELSSLFNAIIFTRAVEDNYRHLYYNQTGEWSDEKALYREALMSGGSEKTLRNIIISTLNRFGQSNVPETLIDQNLLACFDCLSAETVASLMENFYRIRGAKPYEYNFSFMSKHALSRIYERYVSILRVREASSGQLTFDITTPDEVSDRTFGGIYTPQYIARFFVRFLRERIPPFAFKRLSTLEPAVGSGIFLRTLLEMQCDPLQDGITTDLIHNAFENAVGLDIDPNATHAARLSLSLLHLVLTGSLPQSLNLYPVEAIEYFVGHSELKEKHDVILANPPFIPVEDQPVELKKRIRDFMGSDASGRIDTSLAFLKLAVDALKPGGYGLYVLPHTFLISDYAEGMRKYVANQCWIKCLVDLSAIEVFVGTGAYVILLIFQKKNIDEKEPTALVVKCKELVSQALQAAVDDQVEENPVYQLYRTSQVAFSQPNWILTPPALENVTKRLNALPRIEKFMHVRQGFVTGADKVFIVGSEMLANLDAQLFVPYLSDRAMLPFNTPRKVSHYVFYPYVNGEKISEVHMRQFNKTWNYLSTHRAVLTNRAPVRNGNTNWWQPVSPRLPENLMRPKIVTPHIVLVPRFALDLEGKFAVSHSPLLYPKDAEPEIDLLKFFLAILNSTVCFRFISDHAHKYSKGYSVLEVTTLKNTPVPDPSKISATDLKEFLRLVDQRLQADDATAYEIEKLLDEAVLDLYKLTGDERKALGLGGKYA